MSYLAVFIGGGVGSLCRFALAQWALASGKESLWGTLVANFFACLLLGYLASDLLHLEWRPSARLLLATGFCGGFSTFSTFSLEAFSLVQQGRVGFALTYLALSIMLGFIGIGVWRLLS